jgi:uncharacterized cofD-like protein
MKIVSMGGGTGLSTLLKGLKSYIWEGWRSEFSEIMRETVAGDAGRLITDLTAVVTVSDDGGSSGRLRREFQVLPPGDIRNCMVALSEDETLLSRLFQFRFTSGAGLKGHSFGNLFLTALTGVTGDFQEAVKVSGEVLAIRGSIVPSTMTDVTLEAVLDDGRVVKGETKVSQSLRRIKRVRLRPSRCRPMPQTLKAIEQADGITIGPGSLYTSLIPNLLVKGVPAAIRNSRGAKIFICNLMTQPGETTHFSAADHLRAIYDHAGMALFDYVLVNKAPISAAARKRYQAQKSQPVDIDRGKLERMGVHVVEGNFVSEKRSGPAAGRWVRHDPDELARAILDISASHQYWGGATRTPAQRVRANGQERKHSSDLLSRSTMESPPR